MDDQPATNEEIAARREQAKQARVAIWSALAELEKMIDELALAYTDPCKQGASDDLTRVRDRSRGELLAEAGKFAKQ